MTSRFSPWLPALFGLTFTTAAFAQDSLPPAPLPPMPPPPAVQAPAQVPVQRPGRIVGRIIEEGSGAPVAGAQVGIAMGGTPVTSGIDGRYTLLNVPAGPTAITIRAIGYSPKTISGIEVPAGGAVSMDVTIGAQTVTLGEITVEAAVERGSVNAALAEQQNASNVVNSVSAEQISRTPDSDAAQAVQRVSGVTVQDGRYVFIRGLGERYTTTSLNNSRLPSPEPERRVVPLDLFPASMLDGITTTKTFTVDQPGDFSGGQVNLRTREFPLRRTLSLSTSAGVVTGVTGNPIVAAPTTGTEWHASAGAARQIPQSVYDAGGLTGLSDPEVSALIGDFRNAWSGVAENGGANGSFNASLGGEDPILGQRVGYLFSFGYSASREVRENERRAVVVAGSNNTTAEQNSVRGSTATTGVMMGGVANLTLRLGASTKLMFNNTFTRSGDNTATRLAGSNEEFNTNFDITRLAYVERAVRSNQVQGEHLLGRRHHIDWSVNAAGIKRDEPDRSDLLYEAAIDTVTGTVTPIRWWSDSKGGIRTFSYLDESSVDLGLNYRLELGSARRSSVKVGGARRAVTRNADTRAYLIRNGNTNPLTDTERTQDPETIFSQPGRLSMIPDVAVGRYDAEDELLAGYLQLETQFGTRLRAIAGVRVEDWKLDLVTGTQFGTPLTVARRNTDVLPSLGLTWLLGRNTNLRLWASQTVSRPEYREIAPIVTRDIVGGYDFYGNANLQRALIQNYDFRWEWYPSAGEVISAGVFAKFFDEPIERVLVATVGATGTGVTNAKSARSVGVEVEVRRSLGGLGDRLMPFTVFANATVMRSEITLQDSSQAAQRNVARPLTGQARYVLNAGLGYQHPRADLNATILYNVVGERIHEVGTVLLPDAYEQPRGLLDLSLRFPLPGTLSGKFDARNLLDSPYRVTQGQSTRLSYRSGRMFSLGLSWNP